MTSNDKVARYRARQRAGIAVLRVPIGEFEFANALIEAGHPGPGAVSGSARGRGRGGQGAERVHPAVCVTGSLPAVPTARHAVGMERIPLDPREIQPSGRSITHAMSALTQAHLSYGQASSVTSDQIVASTWPQDRVAAAITRAAVSPSSTTSMSTVGPVAVAAFVASLQGSSAAAQLIQRGNRLSLAGRSSVTIPSASTTAAPSWVDEGSAIPVASPAMTSTTLGPEKKLAIIESITARLAEYSAESAEVVVSSLMRQAAARQLDTSMLSTTAASSLQPAGILDGLGLPDQPQAAVLPRSLETSTRCWPHWSRVASDRTRYC